MPETYFNELGVEPLGYVGDYVLNVPVDITVSSAIHRNLALTPGVGILLEVESGIHKQKAAIPALEYNIGISDKVIHKQYSTLLNRIVFEITVYNAIHKSLTNNKWNAPVKPRCENYLETPFEQRYLDTKFDNRYLDTKEENRYLDTPSNIC